MSTQTVLVLRSSTDELDARRADPQREYQTAVVSHEHAMANATVQTQSSLANAAQHMESEHHVQLQAMVVQYQEAYRSNDARFQLAYANLQEHAHVMQHGLGEQVVTAVQRYETSTALVSQVEHQSQLEIRRVLLQATTVTEAVKARTEQLVAESRQEVSAEVLVANKARTAWQMEHETMQQARGQWRLHESNLMSQVGAAHGELAIQNQARTSSDMALARARQEAQGKDLWAVQMEARLSAAEASGSSIVAHDSDPMSSVWPLGRR